MTGYTFSAESDDEYSLRMDAELAEEASFAPCKNGGKWVASDGSCLRCGADQGAECQSPTPPQDREDKL